MVVRVFSYQLQCLHSYGLVQIRSRRWSVNNAFHLPENSKGISIWMTARVFLSGCEGNSEMCPWMLRQERLMKRLYLLFAKISWFLIVHGEWGKKGKGADSVFWTAQRKKPFPSSPLPSPHECFWSVAKKGSQIFFFDKSMPAQERRLHAAQTSPEPLQLSNWPSWGLWYRNWHCCWIPTVCQQS